jgi:hypothetical protein
MADLILRAAAIKAIEPIRYCGDFISILIHLPAVDAVPVVHCKDCKYWKDQSGTPKWLPCVEIQTSGMWFCADGERRESE